MTPVTMTKPKEKVKLTKIQKIEEQISEAQASSKSYLDKIESLRKERAGITTRSHESFKAKEKLRVVDKRILHLQKLIDNNPAEITLLHENLKTEQAVIAQAGRDTLLVEQKEMAEKIVSLSELLVDDLLMAMKSNSKLDIVYARYIGLQKITGVDVLDSKHCEPSRQMLVYLYETLSAELVGGVHQRVILPVPSPQV